MVNADIKVTFDHPIDVFTIEDFKKYFNYILEQEAKIIKVSHIEKIIRRFKSKKSRKVKFNVVKPQVRTNVGGYRGKSLISAVGTNSTRTPIVWLEGGTEWRARRMSANWVSKTSPGSTNVGIGKGYAMRGKKAWGRFPGIKARNFRDAIIEKRIGPFTKRCAIAYDTMLKDAGWTTRIS